jgi:hypothetical protein
MVLLPPGSRKKITLIKYCKGFHVNLLFLFERDKIDVQDIFYSSLPLAKKLVSYKFW